LGNFIAQVFNIILFDEYAHDISGVWLFLVEQENHPPICFSLIAKKYLRENNP
tara:strand:- start:422 stop:580 length:159 start_codon:yes stop_codon:yes gene_type:complete